MAAMATTATSSTSSTTAATATSSSTATEVAATAAAAMKAAAATASAAATAMTAPAVATKAAATTTTTSKLLLLLVVRMLLVSEACGQHVHLVLRVALLLLLLLQSRKVWIARTGRHGASAAATVRRVSTLHLCVIRPRRVGVGSATSGVVEGEASVAACSGGRESAARHCRLLRLAWLPNDAAPRADRRERPADNVNVVVLTISVSGSFFHRVHRAQQQQAAGQRRTTHAHTRPPHSFPETRDREQRRRL